MTVEATTLVAAGQLRAIIERVERLEEEIRALNADKSDVYKEAKGHGFDVAAIKTLVRERREDPSKRQEHDAIVDTYRAALGM